MLKKRGLYFLSLILSFGVILTGCTQKESKKPVNLKFTIAHTNDIHGRINYNEENKSIGFSKISAYLSKLRSEKSNVWLVDSGDMLHGQPVVTVSKGKTAVEAMNILGYNYFTPGNHDFNYGYQRLVELSKDMKCKVLAANITLPDGSLLFKANDMIEIDGAKIGIFGLATPETKVKTNPKNVEGLTFKDPVETAKEQVSLLKKNGADGVIAIAHLGTDDESKGHNSYDVRDNNKEIDLILDGHSHSDMSKIQQMEGKAKIMSGGAYLENLVVVDFNIENGVKSIDLKNLSFDDFSSEGSDSNVDSLLEKINEENAPILGKVIGHTDIDLNGKKSAVRTSETNLTKLVTTAIKNETGADIVFINGGSFRDSIHAGDITMGHVISVSPFGNYIITKSLKGKDIIDILELGFSEYPAASARFPQVAGLQCTLDSSAPAGSRVKSLMVGGVPVEKGKEYIVATNDFLAAGGDGYEAFKSWEEIGQFSAVDEIFSSYLPRISPIREDGFPACITVI
ncbi:MAG: bifunctional metallophosphatase/5'-nucleotidase [Oscillospiraceae bacterium]|jgi:5'-nucleotidase|nr:bifunctional metallophosphatase/5'-nucleotidase [Oscillospiraceae bacterium]